MYICRTKLTENIYSKIKCFITFTQRYRGFKMLKYQKFKLDIIIFLPLFSYQIVSDERRAQIVNKFVNIIICYFDSIRICWIISEICSSIILYILLSPQKHILCRSSCTILRTIYYSDWVNYDQFFEKKNILITAFSFNLPTIIIRWDRYFQIIYFEYLSI